MYGGAGAADLLAAAAAWNGIAVEVSTAASSVGSVITRLSTEHWMVPASLSMAAAVQPYLVWLTCTAESSALAAAQAMASAAAFETAAPHGAAGTVIPGMPGLASATRSSAGFGAPRYGAKPIVMPKPAV